MSRLRILLLVLGLFVALVGPPSAAGEEPVPAWARVSKLQREAAAKAGVPVAFKNDLGMRFVYLPAGSFLGGVPTYWEQKYANRVARPAPWHFAVRSAAYIQITEVTNEQYRRLVPDHQVPKEPDLDMNGPQMPVTGVTQRSAVAFLRSLSKEDPGKRVYRLPTEWEWERACAGGEETFWYWGSKPEEGTAYERLSDEGQPKLGPTRVATLKPNPFGLHDMLGNVAEWTDNRLGPPLRERFEGPTELPEVCAPLERLFRRRCRRGGHAGTLRYDARRWLRHARMPWESSSRTGFRAVIPVEAPPARGPETLSLHVMAVRAEDGAPMELDGQYVPSKGTSTPLVDGRVDLFPHQYDPFVFSLKVPSGRRTWDRFDKPKQLSVHFRRVLGASRAELVVPLYRVVNAKGVVALDKGEKLPRFKVWPAQVGTESLGSGIPATARSPRSKGKFSINKLPWLPGVPFGFRAVRRYEKVITHRGVLYATMPAKYRRSWTLPGPLRLEPQEASSGGGPIGFGQGIGGEDLTPIVYETISPKDAGSITLLCKRGEDGFKTSSPLAFRNLKIDEQGVVRGIGDIASVGPMGMAVFPVVPPGEHIISVYEAGKPLWVARIDVAPGEKQLSIVEMPEPAQVTVRVKRFEGGPAAWARVFVTCRSRLPWHDLAPDGTLRIETRLDHRGEATLHGFSEDAYFVRVSWHGREAGEIVRPTSGEHVKLELTLPKARGWASGLTPK